MLHSLSQLPGPRGRSVTYTRHCFLGGTPVASSSLPPIGARLRAARHRRGVSVRGLAREIGVSASLISQIETDKSSPSVSTLYAISPALALSVGERFSDETADEPAEPELDDYSDEPVSPADGLSLGH